MFVAKRDRLAVVVLAALLYAEQFAGEAGHPVPPELQLVQATRELQLQAHAWAHQSAGRLQGWVLALLPELECSIGRGRLPARCNFR